MLLVATAIPWVQQRIDARLGASRSQEQVLYLWSGEHVRKLAPGFENLLGDIYWLRTVQYFGGQRAFSKEKRFELLEPLIEITTELDPRLEIAYRYGAIFLCEPWPVGKGDAAAGIKVLEKGVRNIPGSWRIRQDLGYFRYIFLQDAPGGARVLLEASRLPGAPFWLEALAGTILARSGDRQTSRAVWTRMFEQAEPGTIRDNARYNLQRLDALDAIEALNAAVARFREAYGRVPRSVGELRSALPSLDPRLLNDPTGAPFQYDVRKGRFWFSPSSNLWRGPE
jgi:hypothetical protein